MKKFISLICALVMVLGVNAAPLAKVARTTTHKSPTTKEMRMAKRIAKAPAQASGETIVIEGGMTFSKESLWGILNYGVIVGGNDDYAVEAYLYPEDDFFTTYSTEAYDIELSVYDAEENESELTISSAELKKLEKGSQFIATGTDEDGNTYKIDLKFVIPDEPKSTVTLDFGKVAQAKYYASDGDWYFWGERADYVVGLDIYTSNLEGEYTLDDFYTDYCGLYAIEGTDTTSVGNFFSANVNITFNEGVYTIAADLFMTDTVLYKVNMTYVKPVAKDTIEHTFQEPVSLDDFGGDWYFLAKDADYVLAIDYYSNTAAGEFGLADLYTEYVGLGVINGTDTTDVSYEDVKIVVTESASQYDIKVTYLGSDLHCYIFTLVSMKAVAEKTEQVNWEDAAIEDLSDYAWYYGFYNYVLAANADSSLVFTLALNKETLEGNYTEADLHAGYTGVYVNDERFAVASAEFSVAAGKKGSYVLTGWLLAKNNVKYEFVIKTAEKEGEEGEGGEGEGEEGEGEEDAVENIRTDVKTVKRIENGQVVIEKNGVRYNLLGTEVK